jgi:hypothetical protein
VEVDGEVPFSAVGSRGWRSGVVCEGIFFVSAGGGFLGWALVCVECAVDDGVYIRSVEA